MKTKSFLMALALSCATCSQAFADIKLEAEDASYSACTVDSDSKYSGGKALRLTETNAKITFEVNIEQKSKYALYAAGNGIGGEKVINVKVNGANGLFNLNDYTEVEVGTFLMQEGVNTIEITPNWTWFDIDYIRIDAAQDEIPFDIAAAPVDANATEAAIKMYSFLYDNFGKKTISGIMTGDMDSANGDVTQHEDVKAVYQASGKYPALVGFDFMNATGLDENNSWFQDYQRKGMELAKDLCRRGGFPAFTWHWRDPSRETGEFYSEKNKVSIAQAMNADGSWNTESELYKYIIKDIDYIADFFLEMQAENMACIFRPLHEASGGWFWWGRDKKAEDCAKLYRLIHEEMVNVKGVHNVLWVWNPATVDDAAWNPGAEYYDVIAVDIYNNDFDYSSNASHFDKLKKLSEGKKLIALSENGPIPDVDKTFDEEAVWSWWMPWYQTWGGNFVSKTSNEEWQKVMDDARIITLEDLQEWSGIEKLDSESVQHNLFDLNGNVLRSEPSQGLFIKDGKKVMK